MNLVESLYFETDGACAYCGVKDRRVLTIHHIKENKPKDESYGNKIVLCYNCHTLHHQEKGATEQEIIEVKKRLIYKTLTLQGTNALKEAHRNQYVTASPYLVNHIVEMGLLNCGEPISFFEATTITAVYELTDTGKQFLEKWDL